MGWSEERLQHWLKENYIDDLESVDDEYSSFDCYSEKYSMAIELKCRNVHYELLIIEKIKYDALVKSDFKKAVYICSTPNGIWAFYLRDLEIDWSVLNLPRQTEFSDTTIKEKAVGFLDIKKGIRLY